MRYAIAADFRMALESRLLARSRASGTSIVRLRKAVVFDRLLARLGEVAAGRWVLKGALALDYRFQQRARTTMDLDLARHDDEAAATADLVAAQAIDLGDHFAFAAERTSRLDALQEARAVRFHVACELAGRAFDNVRLDIAFNPRPASETELLLGPDLLAFADIPPVQVPVVPLDQHVAEKLHVRVSGMS
jgi:predicted nucleotidyltransferase component of viral defense system